MLAGFYALIDWKGRREWSLPLVVVGMNSIAIYVMSWTMRDFIGDSLDRHLGGVFGVAGATFQPVLQGFMVLVVFWCILLWMYRRKIFLRI
jgi:predicted acyltransferase